jgi:hypothetical protein
MHEMRRDHEHVFLGQRCSAEYCEICHAKFQPHWLRKDAIAVLRGRDLAWKPTWAAIKREKGMSQIAAIKVMRQAVLSGKHLGILPRDPGEYRGDEFDAEFARWKKMAQERKELREQLADRHKNVSSEDRSEP